jgi:hypothetical protein
LRLGFNFATSRGPDATFHLVGREAPQHPVPSPFSLTLVVSEKRKKNDDRDRHAEQPQKN